MRVIETELDNWDVVPELEEALQAIDMLDTLIYEIRNNRRETPLEELVESMKEELNDALSILEEIDTEVEFKTVN